MIGCSGTNVVAVDWATSSCSLVPVLAHVRTAAGCKEGLTVVAVAETSNQISGTGVEELAYLTPRRLRYHFYQVPDFVPAGAIR